MLPFVLSCSYWANLKLWFKQKISKEEFDIEARRLLAQENGKFPGNATCFADIIRKKKEFTFPRFPPFSVTVHVHNDFLLAILTRCQIIVSTPGRDLCVVLFLSAAGQKFAFSSFQGVDMILEVWCYLVAIPVSQDYRMLCDDTSPVKM